MQYLVLGAEFLIGTVFVAAVMSKLVAFHAFDQSLREMRVLPARWAYPVSLAVVAAECAVFLCLAVPVAAPAGFALACFLMGAFSLAILMALRRRRQVPCRCFGSSTTPLGMAHVIRNGVLAVVAATGLLLSDRDTTGEAAAILVTAITGTLLGITAARLDDVIKLFQPVSAGRE
ncbi:MauE/DoxX family redox-associated membrane protein [Nonomuraea jiangxiensis]|uniref:Methylamine utilisation protein MauE n=1 Tax=Nonomuraea jiangxiensis TaxID=633440 RepID=A0A1G7Z2A7_9ACTN|nr:MauE/DoxX family redox-associated membrane protein [Nonomuraea jiangxiensis]SDH02320.1 Methylamine utilisation protein MauE [Nonomuraea jiangxiensis]